ncbi:hypothetical protein MSMEG_6611 [Mycolicibacterium smegmatis MC2 155]|uniref:Uncharacterized protein n=1 Tax=Mycolicibacterium smegmatis (strain ATCC 700084 / mc(2)155) TaxID=246196 RepID=A0R6N2_MYCS2|nr:hypothetical protein MSMEG_6611 [Mycolicibacterium smegmatis MC2 155]
MRHSRRSRRSTRSGPCADQLLGRTARVRGIDHGAPVELEICQIRQQWRGGRQFTVGDVVDLHVLRSHTGHCVQEVAHLAAQFGGGLRGREFTATQPCCNGAHGPRVPAFGDLGADRGQHRHLTAGTGERENSRVPTDECHSERDGDPQPHRRIGCGADQVSQQVIRHARTPRSSR